MSHYDKDYKILLELYREVYKELGQDFDEIDKVEDFFMNYEMEDERQREILDRVLKKYKLPSYKRNGIEICYWLGQSPKSKKV